MNSSNPMVKLLAFLAIGASTASAGFLDGQTLKVDYLYPDLSNSYYSASVTVGNGIELIGFPGTDGLFDLNFLDRSLVLTFLQTAPYPVELFNGIRFSDTTSTVAAFTTVSLNASSSFTGFATSRVGFDSENVYINLAGINAIAGKTLILDLNPTALNTPEPASMLLVGLGFIGLRRFKSKKR